MIRSISTLVVIAVMLFGPTIQARAVSPIVRRLAVEFGPDVARVMVRVLWEKAKGLTSKRCVSQVRSASIKAGAKSEAYLTLSRTVEVVMQEKQDSKVLLELRINVEVAALYPTASALGLLTVE